MSTVTALRHAELQHRLPPASADLPADEAWIRSRVVVYAALVDVNVALSVDPDKYCQLTGRPPDAGRAGEVFVGPADQRRETPLVLINPALARTRADAETVIAHEIAHVRWPSYGHKALLFARAQQLLNAAGDIGLGRG